MSPTQRHPDRRPARLVETYRPASLHRPPGGRWSRQARPRPRHDLDCALNLLALLPTLASARSVLLVDEDDFGRQTLGRILEVHGYRVLRAANEEQAREHLRRHPRPGLILLDLCQPQFEDWHILHERVDPDLAGIPVIVVSTADDLILPCGCPSVVAHFEKPVTVCELLAAVHRYLP